ncbi:MAG: tRNA (adenosine(37)-N6)-dimethylallyltransferase MiaA [Ruminococcaceae bacterium]|nr:tRNA (adenosine(37)-N6)-dimethylallyltransferase MiaA [Oscillospiraceae bacterium]
MNNIICIAGPTASGKTALAVEIAKRTGGEVVSCDSMQIYRRMDIGTAKPTVEEMQGIPHHMIDICEPGEDFSVSRYCRMATPIVDDILARGKTAIIAGGTGLYMDSLIRGGDFAPCPATGHREKLEARLTAEGLDPLLSELKAIDPAAADRSQGNPRRIIRALEVYYETGETITAHDLRTQAQPPRYAPVWLGLDFADRAELYGRIDRRVEIMLEMGLLDEIRRLLAEGIPEDATAMQAIGYKEFVSALAGRSSMASAVEEVQKGSRRYAKRQLTWFRRNKNMHWLTRRPGMENEEILAMARQVLQENDK